VSEHDDLGRLAEQVSTPRNYDRPPLHLWDPALSGDIPIRIDAEGNWYHDGGLIKREALVRLFASILRRENDGEYYLVTPAEKWRIQVELHPLVVVDVERGSDGIVNAQLNTGQSVALGEDHAVFLEKAVGNIAAVRLWHGLSALFSRAAWLRLVELGEEEQGTLWLVSGTQRFELGRLEPG
jgi:hypothetical protein